MIDGYPYSPRWKPGSPETSEDAAKSVEADANTVRAQCHRFVKRTKWTGATTDEGAAALGLPNPYSSRPRFSELKAAGLILDSGKRRKGRSGRSQVVWVASEYAPPPTSLEEPRYG